MKYISTILFTLILFYQVTYSQIREKNMIKSVNLSSIDGLTAFDSNNLTVFFNISNDYVFKKEL